MISLIGIISVLGVALGVASLIIVISIMNGFDREIREKIIGTYAHVIVTKKDGIRDFSGMMSRLESMQGIKSVSPFIAGQAILRKNGGITGVLLKGIDAERESRVNEVIKYTGEAGGRLEGNTIILGSELMKNEGISVGDNVEVIIPYSMLDQEKSRFKVIGSFTSGRYDYDANIAVVGLDTARKLYRLEDAVTGIGMRVGDEMEVTGIKHRVQASLGYPYLVRSWMDMDSNLVKALALEKKMMFIILALIVMVACFNISGLLIMMVMEKTRDIGILKAIGANSRGVSLVFLLEGAMIGLIGIILGGASGICIANRVNEVAGFIERLTGVTFFPNDVYYFTEIPVKVSAGDVCTIISVALALALLAGVYPAWKASRLDPVEAIRYE
ncbi:MAG: FtsX-like permease family protein [Candidatus Omnitrophota bacterium]|nr:FtsX-like permease family protein [Candidatus Omnitrophota bacterium]